MFRCAPTTLLRQCAVGNRCAEWNLGERALHALLEGGTEELQWHGEGLALTGEVFIQFPAGLRQRPSAGVGLPAGTARLRAVLWEIQANQEVVLGDQSQGTQRAVVVPPERDAG